MSTPAPVTIPDVIWPDALNTWAAHLHGVDPVNLQHVAADAEYLPPSPVADAMRKAVEHELIERAGGAA